MFRSLVSSLSLPSSRGSMSSYAGYSTIAGKVAFVTGGSRGIGRAVCKELARRGASVVVVGRDEARLSSVLKELQIVSSSCTEKPQQHMAITHDLYTATSIEASKVGEESEEKHEAIKDMFSRVTTMMGTPTILVHCAGVSIDSLLVSTREVDVMETIHTNLISAILLSKYFVKSVMRGRAKEGRIVLVGSVVGQRGNKGQTSYAASKAGLVGFAKSLAQEVERLGMTVNVVSPGYVETDMTAAIRDRLQKESREESGGTQKENAKYSKPEEIAIAIVDLCEQTSAHVNGEEITLDSGIFLS